ncbi:hypothetical protein DL768_011618 [Monosporascus sp. mg162]|nr:hypothetical protein DL768_011618 [Monosporascus sp. mg162]
MKQGILAILFAGFAMAVALVPQQPGSLGIVGRRDGTTEFDPDFALRAKRDGSTEFDPDFALKSKRD